MAPLGKTEQVAVDPWTGAPLIWSEGIGLWNGLSGARVDNGHNATQALPTIELSPEAFERHWPRATIHDPDPTRAEPREHEGPPLSR